MTIFGTPKPTASLSSGLLVRKGQARPAMRPQAYVGIAPTGDAEDLGWNDMGAETPSPPAAKPPVLQQRDVLKRELAAPAPAEAATTKTVPAPDVLPPAALDRIEREVSRRKTKAAFTLRLDPDRHLRLRLASAVANRSAQTLMTEALDAFLESQPDVDKLVAQLETRGERG